MPADLNDLTQFSSEPISEAQYIEAGDQSPPLPDTAYVVIDRITSWAQQGGNVVANLLLRISDEKARQNNRTFFAYVSSKRFERTDQHTGAKGEGSTLEDMLRAAFGSEREILNQSPSNRDLAAALLEVLQLKIRMRARWDWTAYSEEEYYAALGNLVGSGNNDELERRATVAQKALARKAGSAGMRYSDFPLADSDPAFKDKYGIVRRRPFIVTEHGFEAQARTQVRVWIKKAAEKDEVRLKLDDEVNLDLGVKALGRS